MQLKQPQRKMEWTIIFGVIAVVLLFPLFLLLCSEYLEDYIAGTSMNEDQENDGGYIGMTNEAINNHLVEALTMALNESSPNPPQDKNRVRKRRKAKSKKKTLQSPRTSRFSKDNKKSKAQ